MKIILAISFSDHYIQFPILNSSIVKLLQLKLFDQVKTLVARFINIQMSDLKNSFAYGLIWR